MTDMNIREHSGSFRALPIDELDAVVGGNAKAAAGISQPASGKLFEVEEFSFDIEQILN